MSTNIELTNDFWEDPVDGSKFYQMKRTSDEEELTGWSLLNADPANAHWLGQAKNFSNVPSSQLLNTLSSVSHEDQVLVLTERVEGNLASEIFRREAIHDYYSLKEVHELLQASFTALEAVSNTSPFYHGNVNPSSLFIDVDRHWKLGKFNTEYYAQPDIQYYRGYVHPAVAQGQEVNGCAKDLYALGVMTLHICLLQEPIPDTPAGAYGVYHSAICQVCKRYPSQALIATIQTLLNVSPDVNPSVIFQQLLENLKAVEAEAPLFCVQPDAIPSPMHVDSSDSSPDRLKCKQCGFSFSPCPNPHAHPPDAFVCERCFALNYIPRSSK